MGGSPVGHGGRGHLEPDDLSAVEHGAVDLGPVEPIEGYEVLAGPDGPTWNERLENAGISPFVRRHRRAARSVLVVAVVAALVVGGLAGYAWTRPPSDDGVVAADVWEYSAAVTVTTPDDPGSSLQVAYTLIPRRRGDVLRLMGLDGPGVRATAGVQSPHPGAAAADGYGLVAVIPDCDDPEVGNAVEADYHLRVERTDVFGRTVTRLVDLPTTTRSQWAFEIGRQCRQQWFDERITTVGVDVGTVMAPTGTASLVLGLHLRNTLTQPVQLFLPANQSDGYLRALETGWAAPPASGTQNSGELPAGATTTLLIRRPVADCRTATSPEGGLVAAPSLLGYLEPEPGSGAPQGLAAGRIRVAWSDSDRARAVAALLELCAEAPSVDVDVVSSSVTADAALSARFMEIDSLPVDVLRLRLRVRADAARVSVAAVDPSLDPTYPDPVEMTSASSALRRGSADLDVRWVARCLSPQAPPTVALVLTSHGRTYPARVVLDDPELAARYLRVCPGMSVSTLVQSGWSHPE